ncbi:hypothetical protein BGZ57DRAFT_582925 [Hyaloscypha finlandica]|nr:hypothetical protein BGZ57DRAFT_582925 [Hyaloscypha finlandica]
MVVVRKWGEDHISKSLKQIDSNTWLIGGLVLHRSLHPSDAATWNDDGDNSSYTLTDAPTPLLAATTPPDSPYIKLVHEAGDASAVWSVGNNAFCKVRYIDEGVTPESVTLNFVRDQRPSFGTPKVLHHAFGNDRSYLFLQRVIGRTLDAAWPSLNEYWQRHYVNAVVNVCKEMAEWKGHRLGGVDGQNIPEYYLVTPPGGNDFSSVNLEAGCKAMGMDCSSFVFYHADLGPTNIIVEDKPSSGRVGIIDFEISGYFPRGWIRTKFRLSPGMDLSASATDNQTWWRAEVQKMLGADGFEDYAQLWMEWRGYKPPQP